MDVGGWLVGWWFSWWMNKLNWMSLKKMNLGVGSWFIFCTLTRAVQAVQAVQSILSVPTSVPTSRIDQPRSAEPLTD